MSTETNKPLVPRAFHEAVHNDGEVHATLAISRAEAESGTMRTLTLPGGRQVSVTVPAGVGDGSTLRLEGQGMPKYAGGQAGPLVLTIAVPAEVSSLSLSQESTDPNVTVSKPNAELPSVENPSVTPACTEAPDDEETPVLESQASESAPSILATTVLSLLTGAPPTALLVVQPRSATPIRLRFVLVGLAVLMIVIFASFFVLYLYSAP